MPSIFPEANSKLLPAVLALADGTVFKGFSIGAEGSTVAEIIFNTAMSGYQEGITDPGSNNYIITFTYPHIGNTGINPEDMESKKVHAAGLVLRDCPNQISNFRANQTLPDFLKSQGIVAISGVDTRKITRILRDRGAQSACILVGDDVEKAIELARNYVPVAVDTDKLSTSDSVKWSQGPWQLGSGYSEQTSGGKHNVVVYDYGAKSNILRVLAGKNCNVNLVPANTPISTVLAQNPDGVVLSSGPANAKDLTAAVATAKTLIEKGIPVFGLGLGMQLLALAAGADIANLKTGNHGANHPVQDLASKRVYISSQSHGAAIAADNLPEQIQVTHKSLFDGSIQGISIKNTSAFGFQGLADASPGPQDFIYLFDKFVDSMAIQKSSK